jgi:hypothetical protein
MATSGANRKAVALLILVLVLGIALGAVGTTLVNRRVYGARVLRTPDPARPVVRLTQDLSLTSDQAKAVSGILDEMQSKYDGIRQQMGPQFEQVRQQGREQIRQLLTTEQQPKFEDFLRRVDEDRKRRNAVK